jgi:hypothetical protein
MLHILSFGDQIFVLIWNPVVTPRDIFAICSEHLKLKIEHILFLLSYSHGIISCGVQMSRLNDVCQVVYAKGEY